MSFNFIRFVNGFYVGDWIVHENGYQNHIPVWEILGQNIYVEVFILSKNLFIVTSLICNYRYSALIVWSADMIVRHERDVLHKMRFLNTGLFFPNLRSHRC